MKTYAQIQKELGDLVGLPKNLPIVYLLGDTGAGKTCLVRQLLGTTVESFPSVRRVRTTVATTEFIITNEPIFRAAFLFKPESEIAQFVEETLEQAIASAFIAKRKNDGIPDLTDVLGDSPDERFRLRCFLDEEIRKQLGQEIIEQTVPKIVQWADETFPNENDDLTILELALEKAFSMDVEDLKKRIMDTIVLQVKMKCGYVSDSPYPETFAFENSDRTSFIERLKGFLSVEHGSISPAVEKGRVRGKLRSDILPAELEMIVIDSEGVGHDVRETRILSARHFDYFYSCDVIALVEDAETPFRAGGKSALAAIEKNGYLPKMSLVFSRLDRVQADGEGRKFQIREVEKGLRNVLNALKDENINIERQNLSVSFLGNMNEAIPDDETQKEIQTLLSLIQQRHGKAKASFVAPRYDYELLAGFLAQATTSLRHIWADYIKGKDAAPWQTQKAFTKRMSWELDEYRYLKPVAEFADLLITNLGNFLSHPVDWAEEITDSRRVECLQMLQQELSNEIIKFVRQDLVIDKNSNWNIAAGKTGAGSTFIRRGLIIEIIESTAPDLTGEKAKAFKDALKSIINAAISKCSALS